MTTGRPTIITDELISKAKSYLDDYLLMGDVIPSVAGLAVYLGINRSTIYDHKDTFSDILEHIAQNQERLLLNGGLTNQFNATIAKMLLTKHGYGDKVETEVKSSYERPIFQLVAVSPNHETSE